MDAVWLYCLSGILSLGVTLNVADGLSYPHTLDLNRRSVNCLPNEYGDNCTYCVPKDTCSDGHYTCNFSTGNKVCLPGWTGDSCRIKIDSDMTFVSCPDNQCRNGGSCVSGQCCCVDGFTGILCEIEIIECTNTSCKNGGTCKDLIGRYECLCRDGYTGNQCEIPPTLGTTTPSRDTNCRVGTCLNHGTCFEDAFFTYCLCPTWYTGDRCETSLRPKQPGMNSTKCPANYYGNSCTTFCVDTDLCLGGHYVCNEVTGEKVCISGWIGEKCDTRMLPHSLDPFCPSGLGCKNDGQCTNGSCCCKHNYSGLLCQQESIGCLSGPCNNNGTCNESDGDFTCHCQAEYSGKYCEIRPHSFTISTTPASIRETSAPIEISKENMTSSYVLIESEIPTIENRQSELVSSSRTGPIVSQTKHQSHTSSALSMDVINPTSTILSSSITTTDTSPSIRQDTASLSTSSYTLGTSESMFTLYSSEIDVVQSSLSSSVQTPSLITIVKSTVVHISSVSSGNQEMRSSETTEHMRSSQPNTQQHIMTMIGTSDSTSITSSPYPHKGTIYTTETQPSSFNTPNASFGFSASAFDSSSTSDMRASSTETSSRTNTGMSSMTQFETSMSSKEHISLSSHISSSSSRPNIYDRTSSTIISPDIRVSEHPSSVVILPESTDSPVKISSPDHQVHNIISTSSNMSPYMTSLIKGSSDVSLFSSTTNVQTLLTETSSTASLLKSSLLWMKTLAETSIVDTPFIYSSSTSSVQSSTFSSNSVHASTIPPSSFYEIHPSSVVYSKSISKHPTFSVLSVSESTVKMDTTNSSLTKAIMHIKSSSMLSSHTTFPVISNAITMSVNNASRNYSISDTRYMGSTKTFKTNILPTTEYLSTSGLSIVPSDITPTQSPLQASTGPSIIYPDTSPKASDTSNDVPLVWWVILIIVLVIVLIGVSLIILAAVIIRKRRSDFRSLVQNPEAILAFDKEHFSVQPEFANPTYEPEDDSDDESVKHDIYVVNK